MKFLDDCWSMWIPLVLVTVASVVLFFWPAAISNETLFLVSHGGCLLVLFGNLLYVGFHGVPKPLSWHLRNRPRHIR